MPPVVIAGAVAAAGAVGSSMIGASGAKSAANAQAQANAQSIAEQRRQFDTVQKLLAPYVQGGNQGLDALLALSGAQGVKAQQQGVSALERSPMFQSLARQGEQGILQNASATGGLRGGNVQGALAQFRPALLNQQIQQQMATYGGLASMGQNAAAGVGNAGVATGQSIGGLMQDTGQARAYGALGSSTALGQGVASLGNILGGVLGGSGGSTAGGATGGFGGVTAPIFGNASIPIPQMPGIISGYGGGTFDISGKQVTF